jgi:glycosyltransferase involved in cell wall biosynthesis
MSDSAKITVLLCTYNRSRTLGETIESVAAQTLPESLNWEMLIVDNNSNDNTRLVVEGFRDRYPGRIRYVFEPKQGLSYARNTGIREAKGEILVFIDDDGTAEVGWLQNLTANLHSGEWAGVGGRLLPPPNFALPPWLPNKSVFTSAPLGIFDLGLEATQLSQPPFGGNMAFRKEVFDSYGGFRTDLGREGRNLISNEDTEFGRRLFAAGLRLRYEPLALIYHRMEGVSFRPEYFLRWWFNKGRSDVRESHVQSAIRFFGVPFRLAFSFVFQVVRWMTAVRPSHRFDCKLAVWAYAGRVFESYQRRLVTKRDEQQRNVNLHPPV